MNFSLKKASNIRGFFFTNSTFNKKIKNSLPQKKIVTTFAVHKKTEVS